MKEGKGLILAYDIGTTGNKTCLFEISDTIRQIGGSLRDYELTLLPHGGAEQDPEDWWRAMRDTTREILAATGIGPESIDAVSFCTQMQGVVLVDRDGEPVRPAMSYMDQRGGVQRERGLGRGLRVAGMNLFKLLYSLRVTGAVSASVKDPLWKYKWVEEHEPDVFHRVYKWLDVKEYLLLKATDRFCMTEDSANVTFLYDSRPGRRRWSLRLCRLFGVDPGHLPEVILPSDTAGTLTARAADELGLTAGIPVFGGGGDATIFPLGAGCSRPGDLHVYMGTSGWVSRVVRKRHLDLGRMIASILGARPGYYNYFAEQETAGKCLDWFSRHVALDEIGVYLRKVPVESDPENRYRSLIEYLQEVIAETEPGSGGVIFTPWLHGNRSPFEDPFARGIFFNLGIETGKKELLRAVVEGVCYHTRWMLEGVERRGGAAEKLRFVGGGALSDAVSRILADITGRTVEAVENPQNAGAMGAAALAGISLGLIPSFDYLGELIPVRRRFEPDETNRSRYDHHYRVFKGLYRRNRRAFADMNRTGAEKERL